MILRPVSPVSAFGPPISNRPVGLTSTRTPSASWSNSRSPESIPPASTPGASTHRVQLVVGAGAVLQRVLHTERDVLGLFLDRRHDPARVAVDPELRVGVPDVEHGLADDARDVDVAIGGDLAGHQDQAGGD